MAVGDAVVGVARLDWDYSGLATAYAKRPGYAPRAVLECPVVRSLRPEARVCDVGAGTANLTVVLRRLGLHVVALEPNSEMQAVGRARTSSDRRVRWVTGLAEAVPLGSGGFDLVTFGSSFNVTDQPRALREAARLLRPAGGLLCVWNHRRLDDPLQRRIEEAIRRHVPSFTPGSRRADQAPVIAASGCFEEAQSVDHGFVARIRAADCLDAWRSHLSLARQAGPRLGSVLEDIRRVLEEVTDPILEIPYVTRLWFCRSRTSASRARVAVAAPAG